MRSNRRGLGKGKGVGYRNLIKTDPIVHHRAGKGQKTYSSPTQRKMSLVNYPPYIVGVNTSPFINTKTDVPFRYDVVQNGKILGSFDTEKEAQKSLRDSDGDGVPDILDCKPFDSKKQDFGLSEEQQKIIETELDSKITKNFEDQRGNIVELENGEEWLIFDSEDEAEEKCKDYVKEMLEDEPETFVQDWLEGHIDVENLKDQLESDVSESNSNYWNDIADESDDEYINRQRRELLDGDYITEEEAKDENFDTSDAVEEAVEKRTEEDLEDPIEYLKGIYGDAQAMKEAIRIGGINEDEASEDAINQDGIAHFFASYDGNQTDFEDGSVGYRVN